MIGHPLSKRPTRRDRRLARLRAVFQTARVVWEKNVEDDSGNEHLHSMAQAHLDGLCEGQHIAEFVIQEEQ